MIAGFKCPEGVTQTENKKKTNLHSFDFCINKCPSPCFPTPLISTIRKSLDRDVHSGKMVSVTGLKGCRRSLWLERNTPYYASPASLWFSTRGVLIHSIVTDQDMDKFISEVRFYLDVEDATLSGQIDLYDKDKKILYDFKTIGDRGLDFIINDGPKADHVMQTNCYKYLMENGYRQNIKLNNNGNTDTEKIYEPLEVKEIRIIYLTMMSALITGGEYRKTTNPRPFNIASVEIYDSDIVKEYIEKSLPEVREILESDREPDFIPNEDEQGWLCGKKYKGKGYCKVTANCSYWRSLFKLEERDGEAGGIRNRRTKETP